MADGTDKTVAEPNDGFRNRQLPDGLRAPVRNSPPWLRVFVAVLVLLFLVNQGAELVKSTAQGQRFLVQLAADPAETIRTLVVAPDPGASASQAEEILARLDRIKANQARNGDGTQRNGEERERRNQAVEDLVADPNLDARAAAAELASDDGNVDSAVTRLEQEARAATAEGAAKWRRIGDLVAGFDTARALYAYEEAFRLQPVDFSTVVLLARQRRIAGDLSGALELAAAMQRVASSERESSITGNELGLLHLEAGNIRAARLAYGRSLEVAERLAASNPGSAQAQRDLSVSLIKLGDVEVQAGDLAAARATYGRSLEVAERLAASNPGSAEAQRDLSVSLEKLGDMEEREGELAGAVGLYERSLPIARVLAESNPSHPGFQKDLEITERRLEELRAKAGAE